jgi:sugar porter (SP) family MFS transporter
MEAAPGSRSIAEERGLPSGAYVSFIAAVAAAGGFLFGFDTAIVAGAQVEFGKEFRLEDLGMAVAVSSLLVGCIAGASAAGWSSDRFGRRKMLLVAALLFAVSAVGAGLARSVGEFVLARLVGGVAIGVASMLSPMYIAEVSPADRRGRLVTLNQTAIITGILVSYVVAYLLADEGASSWRWMFTLAVVPAGGLWIALLFVPESPRWLVKQGRKDEALSVLERIGGPIQARSELEEIEDASAAEAARSLSQLFQPGLRKALVIGVALAVLQQITGINTILYYAPTIFLKAGFASESDALLASLAVGAVNFVFTLVALGAIDRLGRKPLLLVGSGGMAASLALLGAALKLQGESSPLLLAGILSYVAFFAVGLGPVVWLLLSEIFPTAIRGRAMSLATISLWVACFVVSLTFLPLVKVLSMAGAFWLYAAICLVTFVFVWRVIPETRGQSLEEIERFWRRSK